MTHKIGANMPIYNQCTPENIKLFDREKISENDHLHRMFMGVKYGDILYCTFGYYNIISQIDIKRGEINHLELDFDEPYYQQIPANA